MGGQALKVVTLNGGGQKPQCGKGTSGVRYWWQRNKKDEPGSSSSEAPAPLSGGDASCGGDRLLENVATLGRFAWQSYQAQGRGLLLFREEHVEDRSVDLAEQLEYFTLEELDYLGDELLATLRRHVDSYVPETEFPAAIFGDELKIRVIEVTTPLAEL